MHASEPGAAIRMASDDSVSQGSTQQLAMKLLKRETHIDLAHVPYNGCPLDPQVSWPDRVRAYAMTDRASSPARRR
jgi:hypothetical protein